MHAPLPCRLDYDCSGALIDFMWNYLMKLTVKLFAYFRDNRFISKLQEYPDGSTVGDIVDSLEIERDDIGITMINSKHCGFEDTPSDDDILAIFPLVGGG